MSASVKLLDNYKKVCGIASDNACAASLGVTRSAVSLWRNGKGHPEADSVERMCEATGEPLAHWLPLIESERARTPSARKAWLRLAQVAGVLPLIAAALPIMATAVIYCAHNSGAMYIMSNMTFYAKSFT